MAMSTKDGVVDDTAPKDSCTLVYVAQQRNGMYRCPASLCKKQEMDLTLRQLRDHARNVHKDIKVKKKPLSAAQFRARRKKSLKKYATKKKSEYKEKKNPNVRDLFGITDVVKGLGVRVRHNMYCRFSLYVYSIKCTLHCTVKCSVVFTSQKTKFIIFCS